MSKPGTYARSSKVFIDNVKPRFNNPSKYESIWTSKIPDSYPDILRAPAVSYKPERDNMRIKANKYISFVRPYRGKQGLLLIGREYRPIIIEETNPGLLNILPMRLDRDALLGTWIFSISLYEAEGLIQLEDCIVCDGEQIRSSRTFKDRYLKMQQFVHTIWYQDKQFQLNWDIQIVDIYPLESIRLAIEKLNGGYICLMPELAELRLIRVLPIKTIDSAKIQIEDGPREFTCIPFDGKPDVYDLKDESDRIIGRASIQTLSISQKLQYLVSIGQPLKVMAEWNKDFESYIVTSII
jgi:hypothetical protein